MDEEKKINKSFVITGLAVIAIILVAGVLLMPNSITGFSTLGDNMVKVKIETTKGDIILELDKENAPVTVQNFLSYVDESYYDGLVFHRVIDGFMIQGGGFYPNGKQKQTKAPIELESDNGLSNVRGTIAMARTNDPNSATSQFFINTVDNNFLDKNTFSPGYAVFGKVVEGMDVVDSISKVKIGNRGSMSDWPTEDVKIISIKRI